MLQLLPSVLWDCKVLVPVELPSQLPCSYLAQQACAIFCQTQDDVKLGKQILNCLIPNHRAEKNSCLLSFIWVMVSSILWYIWLPSYCPENYTVNIQKYLQKQSMFFLHRKNIFLWLYFFEHIKHSSISSMIILGLEFVTVKSELEGRNGQPARCLLQHQALKCVVTSGLLHCNWELSSAKVQWVCCGV